MMAAKGLRLDGYVRVSRVGARSGEGFISPDVQSDAIRQWAGDRHILTLHEPELDRSGGTMDRPVFGAIMERVRAGESDGIVVYRVDRFARSLLGALSTLDEIAQAGGVFASVSDNVDMTTAQGRAFLQMQLVFAQLFREQIREGFDTATASAVARGIHITNAVPPGFDRVDKRLVPNAAAPIIRELFERRASGEGISVLARWLDEALPRDGEEHWTPAHVGRLLKMRVYLGEAHYGTHRNADAHEAIVSGALFERASAARAPAPPRSGKTHLLAGLIRCAGCRYLMAPSKSGINGRTLVYRCRGKHTAGLCPEPATIARSRIEGYVEREALEGLAGIAGRGVAGTDLDESVSTLDALRAELEAFAADQSARAILGEHYHRALEARVSAVRDAERACQALAQPPAVAVSAEDWQDWTTHERRLVLASAIDAVFVRKATSSREPVEARTFIAWRGSGWDGEDDLPRRGRVNGPVRPVAWPSDDDAQAGMSSP